MALEKDATLTKKEKAIMRYVYNEASKNKGVCIMRPVDVYSNVSYDLAFEADELEPTLKNLELDDYFDLTKTDKRGELYYCINMHKRGLAFARDEASFKKKLAFKISIAVISGALTAVVGWLIKFLLNKFV